MGQRNPFSLRPEKCPFTAHQNCFTLGSSSGSRGGEEKAERGRVLNGNVQVMDVKDGNLLREVVFSEMQGILENWAGLEVRRKTEIFSSL